MPTWYVNSGAATLWANATAYNVGDRVYSNVTTTRAFECTTGGTSGGSEPTWNTTDGGTTADNTVTWTTRLYTSSWANAATQLSRTTGAAAGDEVWVENGHSEDPGASVTYNWSNGTAVAPVKIICVDKDASDALSTGATIAQTVSGRTISLQGYIYVDGMTFHAADYLFLSINTNERIVHYKNCTFKIVVTSNARSLMIGRSPSVTIDCESCTFDISGQAGHALESSISSGQSLTTRLKNCTIIGHATANTIALKLNAGWVLSLVGCTFTTTATSVVSTVTDVNQRIIFRRCKLPSYTNLVNGVPGVGSFVQFEQCSSGTISDTPETFSYYKDHAGTIDYVTAQYRTGGASDGTSAHSWELTPSANAEEQIYPLRSPPMSVWVAGGSSKTFTVYTATAADVYDDEVWIELEGPDDTASPNTSTQGYWYSSRLAWRGTRAVLTRDSGSTWEGTGTGTDGSTGQQKIAHTYTPQESGPVVIRVCYAKTSGTALYVDPKIVVT